MNDDVLFEISLQILNLVGFELQNDVIVIECSLDHNKLQTDKIVAKTDKVFVNTFLSWTTAKREIKRMKAENLPLKIECFRLRERNKLESMGYVLLPLRNVATFLTKNNLLSSPRWHKLINVPNNVVHNRPELLINVIIQPEQDVPLTSSKTAENCIGDDDDDLDDPNPFLEPQEEEQLVVQEEEEKIVPIKFAKNLENSLQKEILPANDVKKENEDETSKYISNLEKWKCNEKEQFLDNLKKIENNFLETLFEEWKRKRQEEELKLKWSIEECGRLSKKLEEGYSKLKTCVKTELAEKPDTNLQVEQELKRAEKIETELREEREENKVLRKKLRELEKERLEDHREKDELQRAVKIMEQELMKMKDSKDYYKQKWVQLIREVNKLDNCSN